MKATRGYIRKKFYRIAIVWLDMKGLPCAIKKVKRAKGYNVYINFKLVAFKRSRKAANLYIWNYFKEKAGL